MPQRNQDLNDRLQSDTLPSDGSQKVVPITKAAREAEDDANRLRTVRQLLGDSMERARQPNTEEHRCTTGHYWVDRATGGIRPVSVWLIGADTNWGKSTELVAIADENLQRGKRVLIVSTEDDQALYGDRLMCRRCARRWNEIRNEHIRHGRGCAGSSSLRLRDGKLQDDEFQAVTDVVNSATDDPVFLFAVGKTIEWVSKKVRGIIAAEGIDLVLFDYLQAFDNQRPQADRRLQINYIARVMTDTVKEAGKAGVIASQITISEGKKRPDKHSIRESRDVSNGAEVIALGFTADRQIVGRNGNEIVPQDGRCLFVDKVKGGIGKHVFYLPWDQNSASFQPVHRSADREYERLAQEYPDLLEDFDDDLERRYP